MNLPGLPDRVERRADLGLWITSGAARGASVEGAVTQSSRKIGGVNVFGNGLALYDKSSVVGTPGVSGDTSCADHNIAWRVRKALGLGKVPGGVSPNKDDGIIYDIANGATKSGFGHPTCGGNEVDVAVSIGADAR